MAQVQSPSLLPTHNPSSTAPALIPMQNMSAPRPSNGITMNTSKKPAWKVEGYQEFSKWMASENDFFVFRRFESLNANTILWMQHSISELEARLEQIHKEIEGRGDNAKNSSFKWDENGKPERIIIMQQLSGLLLQYSKILIRNIMT
jgi:hypothetical protein